MIIRKKINLDSVKKQASLIKNEEDAHELAQTLMNDQIEDIICNNCGSSCRKNQDCGFEGLIEVEASGGYESEIIGDGSSISFSLCEGCLIAITNKFKHPPLKKDENGNTSGPEVSPLLDQYETGIIKSHPNDTNIINLNPKKQ